MSQYTITGKAIAAAKQAAIRAAWTPEQRQHAADLHKAWRLNNLAEVRTKEKLSQRRRRAAVKAAS